MDKPLHAQPLIVIYGLRNPTADSLRHIRFLQAKVQTIKHKSSTERNISVFGDPACVNPLSNGSDYSWEGSLVPLHLQVNSMS